MLRKIDVSSHLKTQELNMKLITLFVFFTIVFTIDGQNLKFYDNHGNLAIDKRFKINIQNLECIKKIESVILSKVAPNIVYPQISIEAPSEGIAVILLERKNKNIKIYLQKGIEPWIDKEIIQKVTSIKTQFLDSAFCDDFVYYIPFEFKIGDANYQNDSCISIVYPGKKAEIFQNSNGVRIFQFESANFLEKEELLKIDSLLLTGFNPYIKTRKSGLIGIKLVKKKVYRKHLEQERDRIFSYINRVYYGISNEKNENILKIVFSKEGLYGTDIIEYDLKRNKIERYYTTLTH